MHSYKRNELTTRGVLRGTKISLVDEGGTVDSNKIKAQSNVCFTISDKDKTTESVPSSTITGYVEEFIIIRLSNGKTVSVGNDQPIYDMTSESFVKAEKALGVNVDVDLKVIEVTSIRVCAPIINFKSEIPGSIFTANGVFLLAE